MVLVYCYLVTVWSAGENTGLFLRRGLLISKAAGRTVIKTHRSHFQKNFSPSITSTYKNYEQKLPKNLPVRTTTAMNRAYRKPPKIVEKVYENFKYKKKKNCSIPVS